MAILIIASASRSELSGTDNMSNHLQAMRKMEAHTIANVDQAVGYYKEFQQDAPSLEQSLVFPIDEKSLPFVKNYFLNVMNQDCIMAINPNTQDAGLIFSDKVVELGKFQTASRQVAECNNAFTYFKGKHWIVK